ncbi:interleukin-15 receptor subunit alpha isoform X1 [Panthera uncia]|uniref:interleukin-15 receptor subunit alpha isoform X1 n=1 Tax=Panthera uncia TaxID=29064 RepID=UPI0020FF94C6|nr:interleukin-15 receptor subunit alpha isoform X1 [Panthera uncia]
MGRRPPQGCGLRALPAPLPLLLLLLLLLRPPATPGVTCPPPTSVEHADIRVKSYKLNSTERYTCNTGFKRKAGTSTLTECVLNKTTNTAHWTIPNLKCIRDPSLTHLKPSSTEMPAGVTPEPESTSLSGKEPAFTSKSDSTVATKAATEPGSRLIPSKPPAAGTTGVINNEPSRAPAQTTAKALEHTPSASQETPAGKESPSPRGEKARRIDLHGRGFADLNGICRLPIWEDGGSFLQSGVTICGTYSYSSGTVTAAIVMPVTVLCVVCVGLLVCYKRSRQTSQIRTVAMENMEEIPMTGGTNGRDEDAENQAYDLGNSRGKLRAAKAEARMPTLP